MDSLSTIKKLYTQCSWSLMFGAGMVMQRWQHLLAAVTPMWPWGWSARVDTTCTLLECIDSSLPFSLLHEDFFFRYSTSFRLWLRPTNQHFLHSNSVRWRSMYSCLASCNFRTFQIIFCDNMKLKHYILPLTSPLHHESWKQFGVFEFHGCRHFLPMNLPHSLPH